MFKDVPQISRQTKFKDLMETWKNSRRAYAVIPNEWGFYSAISARKMLEIGKRRKTDLCVLNAKKENHHISW